MEKQFLNPPLRVLCTFSCTLALQEDQLIYGSYSLKTVCAILRSVWSSFVDYWTVLFSGESCASCFRSLICAIIGLFRSQGHCFVFGWDLTGLTELFQLFRFPGERCFVFEIICTLQLKEKCLFDHCLLLANLKKMPGRPCQKLTLELI